MKVLLTGAGGFLGVRVADRLLAHGVKNLRLMIRQNQQSKKFEFLRERYPDALIETAVANLTNKASLNEALKGVDMLIHAAAGMKGAAADMFSNSVIGTQNLLEEAKKNGVSKYVLISSFSVYNTFVMSAGQTLKEDSPLEDIGIEKGLYAYTKVQQEKLFTQFLAKDNLKATIIRPGVIYGPGGSALSSRVGVSALGVFASLGNGLLLPLTHVDNCADAIAIASLKGQDGEAFNVTDDELPTCSAYLKEYRSKVQKLRTVWMPYPVLLMAAKFLERYHIRSKGQLPAILTPYVVKSMYKDLRYSNDRLKALGWSPSISIKEGMQDFFLSLKGN